MNDDKMKELMERRQSQLRGLVSVDIPEVAPELQPILEAMAAEMVTEEVGEQPRRVPTKRGRVGRPTKTGYVQYNLKIQAEKVEYLKNYAYTKSCHLKRKYTLVETINEAIAMLEKHTTMEILTAPEWRK